MDSPPVVLHSTARGYEAFFMGYESWVLLDRKCNVLPWSDGRDEFLKSRT